MRNTILAAALLLIAGLTRVETQVAPPTSSVTVAPAAAAKATLDRYCATCHNQRVRAGGLAFDGLDVTAAHRDAPTWEKVVRKVRTGMMPPVGAPRPDRATLDRLAGAIEQTIDAAAKAFKVAAAQEGNVK